MLFFESTFVRVIALFSCQSRALLLRFILCIVLLAEMAVHSVAQADDVIQMHQYNPKIRLEHKLVAFKGELLGFNGGEWGGGLIFKDVDGKQHVVLGENIQGIFLTSEGVFVFTGLSHLGSNVGAIWEVTETSAGLVRAERLHHLKGAPEVIQQLVSGGVVFYVYSGQFTSDGMALFDCMQFTNRVVSPSTLCK